MMMLELKLRFNATSPPAPTAWLLGGDDPADWLAAATTFANQSSLRLLPLPCSPKDRQVIGALLVSTAGALSAKPVATAIGYFQAAPRLFLPCNAQLDPPVSEAELVEQLAQERRYVWHPTIGLIGMEETEALDLSALVTLGGPSDRRWNLATTGMTLAPRLTSVKPEETPGVDIILDAGRGNIGSEGGLAELPPSDAEPNQGAAAKSKRAAERALASAVRWLTNRVPETSSERTWVNGLEDWAQKKLEGVRNDLSAIRHKEILRLMKLLETDPDQGLKFAIPFSGGGGRGVAEPSGRLGPRDINFDLTRIGGGGPTDSWDLDNDYRLQLSARYRELANRELQLGRYRRAAYIFGELLNDLHAAANALKQGRHFREAAVLYRDRLNQPLEAARCLEEGALWSEAIELYLEEKEFEIAGDLYIKLNQPELAEGQYRIALQEQRRRNLPLNAARILRDKLNSEGEALQELANGWPHSSQAVDCANELFLRYAELGMHVEAEQQMKTFASRTMSSHRRLEFVDILATKATRYPDQTVQHSAANLTREIVSQQLREGRSANRQRLLKAVANLVPDDRLLRRDCQRYETQRRERLKSSANSARSLTPVTRFRIGKKTTFCAAVSRRNSLFMAGYSEHQISLAQTDWANNELESVHWGGNVDTDPSHWMLSLLHSNGGRALLHLRGQSPLQTKRLERISGTNNATRVNGIALMSDKLIAATPRRSRGFWLLINEGLETNLVAITASGDLVSSRTLNNSAFGWIEAFGLTIECNMLEHQQQVYISVGDKLLCIEDGEVVETMDFDQPIQTLAHSYGYLHPRLAVGFDEGAMLLRNGLKEDPQPFAHDLQIPKVCVHRAGHLIAADENTCQVYRFQEGKLLLQSETNHKVGKPIAILPTAQENQFAICFESGDVLTYEL